ncbi:MAG: hydroxyphenylacetyl-CoA thioesterase PaaI [Actinomycetota bacterium]|nr:hydroxyphenylacetyl-CoA thioesterase PaaI [Actinomycetota bacterium]
MSAGVSAAEEMFDADASAATLGIELLEVDAGRAIVTMTVRDDMVNGHGTCHGGLIFTLADTAFAVACNSHGPLTVAAAAAIDFLDPARVGDRLTATAGERFRRGRAGLYDVTVSNDAGEPIAHFRGRSHTLARPGDANT